MHAQLAEYFIDALHNSLIREYVAKDSIETLDDTFDSAKRSEALLTRLVRLRDMREVRTVDPSARLSVCYECGSRGHVSARCHN